MKTLEKKLIVAETIRTLEEANKASLFLKGPLFFPGYPTHDIWEVNKEACPLCSEFFADKSGNNEYKACRGCPIDRFMYPAGRGDDSISCQQIVDYWRSENNIETDILLSKECIRFYMGKEEKPSQELIDKVFKFMIADLRLILEDPTAFEEYEEE